MSATSTSSNVLHSTRRRSAVYPHFLDSLLCGSSHSPPQGVGTARDRFPWTTWPGNCGVRATRSKTNANLVVPAVEELDLVGSHGEGSYGRGCGNAWPAAVSRRRSSSSAAATRRAGAGSIKTRPTIEDEQSRGTIDSSSKWSLGPFPLNELLRQFSLLAAGGCSIQSYTCMCMNSNSYSTRSPIA